MALRCFGVGLRPTRAVRMPALTRPLSLSAVAREQGPAQAEADAAAPASAAPEKATRTFTPRYPFSKNVITQIEAPSWPEQEAFKVKRERISKNILPIQQALVREADPELKRWSLFKNKVRTQIPVGSVITVEMWNNAAAKQSFTTISGLLMGVHRRATGTTFRLRNLVEKLGVEQIIPLFSPAIKDIHVVKRALGRDSTKEERKKMASSPFRYYRRSKLYMTRQDERWIKHVPNVIKADRLQRQQDAQKGKGGKRPFQR